MTAERPWASPTRKALRPVARPVRRSLTRARTELDAVRARFRHADLALFHAFEDAPAGGGHQTLRALVSECVRRGIRVEHNAICPTTRACLFNSFNFEVERLERFARETEDCRMVHRVGAVTSLYRGFDDGTDALVAAVNARWAEATLAISRATIEMYRQIGVELVDPHVVHNAVDPGIFHSNGRAPLGRDGKVRIVSVSWSDNPRKGGPTYRWLEQQLDWNRFEYTFVGNTREEFERIRMLPPLPSRELADVLRRHDVFVTATEHDAYSNALVEALSCGLPALYLDSGGSSEAVGEAGFGFRDRAELPALLDRLVDEYEERQAAISLPSVEAVADGYLEVLGLHEFVGARTADAG